MGGGVVAMNRWGRWIFSLLLLGLLTGWFFPTVRAVQPVTLHFFYSPTCPHCQEEAAFLDGLTAEFPQLSVHRYDVTQEGTLFSNVISMLEDAPYEIAGETPMTIIGGVAMTGFNPQTEADIRRLIDRYSETPGTDIVQKVIDGIPVDLADFDSLSYVTGDLIWIPFLGKVPIETVSLGAAAFFLGIVDGFNPCAMWILLLLITLLAQEKNRKRMWILGSAFLLTSALMYFLVMTAWVRLVWSIAGLLWVRVAIGIAAIGFGGWNLFRHFRKPPTGEIGCEVTGTEQKKKTISRIREILAQKSLWLALGGIILLAISVNAVELACSAGLPLLFANLLAFHQVADGATLALIGLYVFFFLLDDLIVFAIAMITLRVTGITNRYSRISQLIGGAIMVILGFLLIFFPQWLFLSF